MWYVDHHTLCTAYEAINMWDGGFGGGRCCDVSPNREYQWRGINYKGECNRNSGVEKYKNWNLKFTGGADSIVDSNCLKVGRLRLSSLRHRNKEGRRISKPTETCEAHQVDPESWKETRERDRKNIWRNNDRKLPEFYEKQSIHPKRSMSSK